jgi:hypothetical protein
MTRRETAIAKSILDYLHDLEGGQAQELVIHAGAGERFMALIPKTEFDHIFATCSKEGWLIAVHTRFKCTLWSISPDGEKARIEMQ